MALRKAVFCLLAGLSILIVGCGSDGARPPATPGRSGNTLSVGPMQVRTLSSADFRTLNLNPPAGSPITFTVMYGSKITRLEEVGYDRIAYAVTAVYSFPKIAVRNLASRIAKEITAPHNTHPCWSPDGKKIVYSTRIGEGNPWRLATINADGTGKTLITNTSFYDTEPAWSPDGRYIAFIRWGEAAQGAAELSAALRQSNGTRTDLIIMQAANSAIVSRTYMGTSPIGSPAWSPDSRWVAFSSSASVGGPPAPEIFIMEAPNGIPWRLTLQPGPNNGGNTHPTWSPDGRKIAFVSRRDYDIDPATSEPVDKARLYTMNPDGSDQQPLTPRDRDVRSDDLMPAWSPDGRQIMFARRELVFSGFTSLCTINADGSDAHVVVWSDAAFTEEPAWCPAPSVRRCLIGPDKSDLTKSPPFGSSRPLAVVGVTADGMVAAATVGVLANHWPGIKVAGVPNAGAGVAGLKVTASAITNVAEDMGWDAPPRVWDLAGRSAGAALVFFSGQTGRIASVLAVADASLQRESARRVSGGKIVLRGRFTTVLSAKDPRRNLASTAARQVVLNARTGEVTSVE